MNWKKGTYFGALLWILIFFEVSILMFGFNLDGEDLFYSILHYISVAIFATFVSLLYFKSGRIKRDVREGLMLGIYFAIIGIVLDAIITVPLFIKDYSFFLDAGLLIGYLETVVFAGIVGHFRN
ncbi:MAG: hypothetical protein Q8Q31_02570 [Nanoarchaeota archaeon]|nr:hypothetical protein [Nanoarchaeota archaeon]